MKIIECPRDAWQGFHSFIPTKDKINYINTLLQVGFDTIDFGSFVSPKSIPQVSDTGILIKELDKSNSQTKLLSIVANERGAIEACAFENIDYIGFPFSISETFQLRNTNSTIEQSIERVARIAEQCQQVEKELVIYISMGFGNPYQDPWSPALVLDYIDQLAQFNIHTFALSDTVGVADLESIDFLFRELITSRPELEFGAHFHTLPNQWRAKIEAAYHAGCRRFDGAILGYGGCPMAQNDLVGNMPTEQLIAFGYENFEPNHYDMHAFEMAQNTFLRFVNT
jgi:hydroxymethylglutaryl-CoA lyase